MLAALTCPGKTPAAAEGPLTPWPHLVEAPTARPLQDWLAPATGHDMPVRPENATRALQTPPAFTWPDHRRHEGRQGQDRLPHAPYEFRLTLADGRVLERSTDRNFLLLDEPLPQGIHSWQVRMAGQPPGAGWSLPRRFEVTANAAPFPVPDMETLWKRATQAARPRLFPAGDGWPAHRDDLLQGRRAPLFARLQASVRQQAGQPPLRPEPDREAPPGPRPGLWPSPTEGPYREALAAMERAAMDWRVSGNPAALAEARRRLAGILEWPVAGPTAFGRNDQLALRLLWSLALAHDLLHDRLTEAEATALATDLATRAEPAFRWYFRNPESPSLNLRAAPFDSHGYLHLANFAALSVLLAGALPEAQSWFHEAVPLLLALGHPWGGDDGGSGNGANYAFYYLMDLLPRWDVLRNGIGIDPAHSAWARHFAIYASLFQPPGMPFVFGDGAGHGDLPLTATVARGLAARTGDRIARRYAAALPQSYPVPALLEFTAPTAPPALAGGPDHGLLPDAAVLPSIGWAALHSGLWADGRASIYFRSGPFGSESHNHADQNSFTVDLDGQRVAIDSGYYDSYGSRHRLEWTRQTRAHNAITFDGGQGQVVPDQAADGRITWFFDDGRLAGVAGDATAAYGGALTRAERVLAFLRPDLLLVHDRLESAQPRRFEWNLHSAVEMLPDGANRLAAQDGRLCVEMLLPRRPRRSLAEDFGDPANAPEDPTLPGQWHARFALAQPARKAEFLAVLRLRCAEAAVDSPVRRPDGGLELTVGGDKVVIAGARARIEPEQSAPAGVAPVRR